MKNKRRTFLVPGSANHPHRLALFSDAGTHLLGRVTLRYYCTRCKILMAFPEATICIPTNPEDNNG